MKLYRFTIHTIQIAPVRIQRNWGRIIPPNGILGNKPAHVQRKIITAKNWNRNRVRGDKPERSSQNPRTNMAIAKRIVDDNPFRENTSPAARKAQHPNANKAAPTIGTPPMRGVGTEGELRSLGTSNTPARRGT